MMSFYSMMFGQSSNAETLLKILNLSEGDFYRYRDCYLSEDKEIAVYTRGGGGNRECYNCELSYQDEDLALKHDDNCVVNIQYKNRQHPFYLRDEDDDYDRTYATFYLKVPDENDIKDIGAELNRDEAWRLIIDALKAKDSE